jgi:hypothetical protein
MRLVFLAATAAALVAGPALASIQPGRTEFEVTRNGEPFGRHSVTVSRAGDGFTAEIAIDLVAKLGPITAFSYRHRCTERWAGAGLMALDCTDQEGRKTQSARATREGDRLAIRGSGFTGALDARMLPSSWWNDDFLTQSSVIDTRTGREMPLRIRRLGVESVPSASGQVRATRYRVEGTLPTDIWYDDAGRWVKLSFTAQGQSIVYRKVTPVAGAPRA